MINDHARFLALVRRQLVGQDRDKGEVVDAENDLQYDQRPKPYPCGRIGRPFEKYLSVPSACSDPGAVLFQ